MKPATYLWPGLWLVCLVLLPASLSSCSNSTAPREQAQNCVAAYLNGAQQQFETEGQRKEIRRALQDMLDKSPEQLQSIRYADYAGNPRAWTVVQLLHRYFVPEHDTLDDDCFYRDVSAPQARAAISHQLDLLLHYPASTE